VEDKDIMKKYGCRSMENIFSSVSILKFENCSAEEVTLKIERS
jgi:hypothetical protein